MDDDRFDAVAKALISGSPRRAALRLLAGGTLAGPLALLGREEAAARQIQPGHRCEKKGKKGEKGKKLGKCVKGAYCNEKGYCKCRGCHVLGYCTASCGGVCCDPVEEECCLTPNQNSVSCRPVSPGCGPCKQACGGQCCELFETCSNGKCCPPGWFGCKGNAPACCPNGTKCCPGINYCCDAALGCGPNDPQVCE